MENIAYYKPGSNFMLLQEESSGSTFQIEMKNIDLFFFTEKI